MKYDAVIWDMDGVLVDTGDYHFLSWREVSNGFGYDYTRDQFDRDFGMKNPDILKRMMGDDTPEPFIEEFCQKKEELFLEMIHGQLQPMPGLLPILSQLREKTVPMALASSSPIHNINVLLEELQIRSFFDAVLSVGSLPGKPEPDVFLEAASRLNMPAASCVVFEDSIAGVAAAKAAGMTCIAITTTNPRDLLRKADLIIDAYENLPEDWID